MEDLQQLSEEDLLTACLWAEARGEAEEGQRGVCNVGNHTFLNLCG